MKHFILLLLMLVCVPMLHAQDSDCTALFLQHSGRPYILRDHLGKAPQLGYLLKCYQYKSAAAFVTALRDPHTWKQRDGELLRKEMDCILQGIGMPNGIEDLSPAAVSLTYIPYGTVGNLGSWSKATHKMKYLFVVLTPAGEPREGIRAFKITGPGGRTVYICTTCGNAFYPEEQDCCHDVKIEQTGDNLHVDCNADAREIPLTICSYKVCKRTKKIRERQQQGSNAKRRLIQRDTLLVGCVNTLIRVSPVKGSQYDVYTQEKDTIVRICKDQTIVLDTKLHLAGVGGSFGREVPIVHNLYDSCTHTDTRWELVLGGGISYNAVPRYENNAVHTRTDKAHFASELMVGYGVSRRWQLGLLVAYQTVAYQDDDSYAGSIPNTYNRVITGRLLPLQAFLKWSDGSSKRVRTDLSLFCGYAIAFKDAVENSNGIALRVKPGTSGGLAGGARFGLTYLFNEQAGLGLAVTGQYTSLRNDLVNYKGWVLPVTLTLHFRLP